MTTKNTTTHNGLDALTTYLATTGEKPGTRDASHGRLTTEYSVNGKPLGKDEACYGGDRRRRAGRDAPQ